MNKGLPVAIVNNVTAYVVPDTVDAQAAFAMASYAARRGLIEGEGVLSYLRAAFQPKAERTVSRHNTITTDGLEALAYNCTATGDGDGDVLKTFVVGDSTTKAAESDTDVGNELDSLTDLWQVVTRNYHVVGYHLTGQLRDDLIGETVNEIGVRTNNSGSGKASDNIMFARAVLFAGDRYTVTADMSIVFVWTFAYRWGLEREESGSDEALAGKDFGAAYFATRMYDLSLYDEVGYIAVGDSTSKAVPWVDQLGNETGRVAVTYSVSGAQLTGTTALSVGQIGGDISEVAPAVGATAGEQVLFVGERSTPLDNDSDGITITIKITFFNLFQPIGHDTAYNASTNSVEITRSLANGLSPPIFGTYIVCFVAQVADGATLSSPGGDDWTTLWASDSVGGAFTYAAFLHVDTGDNLVFTSDMTAAMEAVCVAFRHIDSHNETDRTEGTGSVPVCPAVELADPGIAILCILQRGTPTFTGHPDYTTLEESPSSPGVILKWKPMPIGTAPARAFTSTSSSAYAAFQVALNRVDLATLA